MDVSSRDRLTLTASVEEGCETHKPNCHNKSRQQQPPHKQTRKQELALWWLTILPGWVITRVGLSQNPQYTRAHFGGEAAGCSPTPQHTTMCPIKRNTITTFEDLTGPKMFKCFNHIFLFFRVGYTCLNCFSQTHFASAVAHEYVDPKRRTRFFMEKGFM